MVKFKAYNTKTSQTMPAASRSAAGTTYFLGCLHRSFSVFHSLIGKKYSMKTVPAAPRTQNNTAMP